MNKRWLRSPKRWSPLKGFREVIISDGKVRTFEEQVELDDWEAWGQKESVPFEVVPFKCSKIKKKTVRTIISIITP